MNKGILRRGGDCSASGRGLIAHARTNHNVMALALSAALAGLGGVSMATPALAQQSATVAQEYAIPAGSLREALDALGQQSDVAIVFSPDLVDGKRTSGVTGRYTPIQALRRLLEGSGLELNAIDATTYVLKRAVETAPREPLGVAGKEREDDGAKDMPTILVRRPYTDANVDIVRTENDPQPYYIFQNRDILESNAINLEDFIKQKLTMNATLYSNSQVSYGGSNFSTVDLRGFGTDQTLILINGRRVSGEGSAWNGVEQFDLNSIAPSMVERIEILPSSASAIYGGSAVGGVINVILNRDFTGGELRVTYDTPLDTNAPTRSITGAYGWSFLEGRTHIALGVSYRDNDSLLYKDRQELVNRGYSRVLERSPGLLFGPGQPFRYGTTPNISSADGSDLILKDGTSLHSPFTYIPLGTSPTTSSEQLRAGLLENAGRQNMTSPLIAGGFNNTLLTPFTVIGKSRSLIGAIRHKLLDRLELIGEVFYGSNESMQPVGQKIPWITPASSPANPFSQDVVVAPPLAQSWSFDKEYESMRVVAGFVLDLPQEWRMQGDYTWNRSESFTRIGPLFDGDPAVIEALANGTMNPFVDTLAYPLNFNLYLTPMSTFTYASASTLDDIGLRLSGPVGRLPAGRPNLTIGLGHREEQQPWGYNDQGRFGLRTFFPTSQRVSSIYAEAIIPLVGPINEVPGIRNLDLQIANRWEKYTVDNGTASRDTFPPDYEIDPGEVIVRDTVGYRENNSTIGLRYQPADFLTFRASYATAFLPPGFSDFIPGVVDPTRLDSATDPRRGYERAEFLSLRGGNPDLKPMSAKSWNVGMIFEPSFLEGARVGIEWFHIERTNLIFSPSEEDILDNEALYPDRVVRAAPEPGDPYGVGRVTFVDASILNANHVATKGFDVSLGYRHATERYGQFSANLLGTIVDKFTYQGTPGSMEIDVVGQPYGAGDGGPVKVRANATLGWEKGAWRLGWTTVYFDSYAQYDNPLYIAAQGGTTVPSQVYHNLSAGYRLEFEDQVSGVGRVLSGVDVTLGVRNVFNTLPAFDAYQYDIQYSSPFVDYRLRSVQLSISGKFR